jgi:hypothetical protein
MNGERRQHKAQYILTINRLYVSMTTYADTADIYKGNGNGN